MKEKTKWILVLGVVVQMAHFSGFLADKKFETTVNLFVEEIV